MMVADGRIENLSPYLEEDEEWRNMIEPAVMEGCTDEDGNIYLGPISTAAFACAGMFWNPELFAEAGIEKFRRHGKNSGTAVTGCRQTESHRLDFTLKEPAGRRC